MKNNAESFQEPEPLNAGEFMLAVVEATPAILHEVQGIVNVGMLLSVDENGQVASAEVARCNSITGKPVRPDEPEIMRAAVQVVETLRFKPARRGGVAVRRDGLELSFGFTTAAAETNRSQAATRN